MSDEYKDRYIIIALLKTLPRHSTDNIENTLSPHTELDEGGPVKHN